MNKKNFISSSDLKRIYGKSHIFYADYCSPVVNDLKKKGVDPSYYNSGTYGWNYDVYDVVDKKSGDNVAIVSGYRVPASLYSKDVSKNSGSGFKPFFKR